MLSLERQYSGQEPQLTHTERKKTHITTTTTTTNKQQIDKSKQFTNSLWCAPIHYLFIYMKIAQIALLLATLICAVAATCL